MNIPSLQIVNPAGHLRVVVTKPLPGTHWLDVLIAAGCRVEIATGDEILSGEEIIALIGDHCHAAIGQLTESWNAGLFAALKHAGGRAYSNYAVGYNNVDVPAASACGIPVGNTPGVLTETTAEIAVALTFSAARRIVEADRFMRGGQFKGWLPGLFLGNLLHDSICKFRRENKDLLADAFHQVLELAARARVLQVCDITVAIDGTKILANASKHSAVSYGHAVEQMQLASTQISELLAKAETADSTPLQDGLTIPEEIKRREDRIAKLGEAKQAMEERAKERLLEERAEYEEKIAARQAKEESTGHKARGKAPEPPKEGPRDKDQYNFTDPESRIMKDGGGFEQCYNAQAAVEVATMLVVGQHVCDAPNDKQQLVPTLAVVSPVINHIDNTLVDSGYYSEAAVVTVEAGDSATTVYAAMKRQSHGRSVAQLEARADPPRPPADASVAEQMIYRLETAAGKQLYGLRKETVEPVFGIIKQAIGFRRFMLRGLEKAGLEWTLVTTSYNLKRLFNLGMKLTAT